MTSKRQKIIFFLAVLLLPVIHAGQVYATALDDPAARAAAGGTAGGGLVPVVPEIDAGQVTIGATAQIVMRFKNEGAKEIKISSIDLYPSSTVAAAVSVDDCSKQPVGPVSECAVVVTVKGIKSGNWRVEALVRHDAKSRITTAAMKGTVEAGNETTDKLLSDIETIPDELDFESPTSGRPLVRSIILRNVTSDPIDITNLTVSPQSAGYSLQSECKTLIPGAACAMTVTWAPTTRGQSQGVVLVEHTGSTKVASVSITGNYSPEIVAKADIFPQAVAGKGLLVASQEALDFGTVSNEASITVSLVNVGDADLAVGDIELGGIENGLTVARTGCRKGMVLRPIEACPLTVSWAAVREGAIIDDIQIRHDGARGVLVLPVRGVATGAVNRDSKAVIVETTTPGKPVTAARPIDKSQALEGFVITSMSGKRAIINGPGGSRVVNTGQRVVIGGVEWTIDVTALGIDFISGRDRVRLLFDRSLSSVNRAASQSGQSATVGAGTTAPSTGVIPPPAISSSVSATGAQ